MEIFRHLGRAEEGRQQGNLPIPPGSTAGHSTRLNAPDIAALDLMSDPDRLDRGEGIA
jgi:hypothetical protein